MHVKREYNKNIKLKTISSSDVYIATSYIYCCFIISPEQEKSNQTLTNETSSEATDSCWYANLLQVKEKKTSRKQLWLLLSFPES